MELRNLCRIFILLFARHDDAPTTEKILSQWLFNHPLVSVGIARDLLILKKRLFHSNIFKKKKTSRFDYRNFRSSYCKSPEVDL